MNEKEYWATVTIQYTTNIYADSEQQAIKRAKDYACELPADYLRDNVEVTIDETVNL